MKDDNWPLIKGEDAHQIEVLNQLAVLNQIEALVIYSLHHFKSEEHGCAYHLTEGALKELHKTATFMLLRKPGEYRTRPVHLELPNGEIIYHPPPAEEVSEHLQRFFAQLSERWPAYTAVEAAAYTLWFINWVHPFPNGNGRKHEPSVTHASPCGRGMCCRASARSWNLSRITMGNIRML